MLNTAGMRSVVMAGKTMTAAAVASDPVAGWHSEASGDINVSNPTFEARVLTAQTLAVRCTCSLELSQDSPDFGAQLSRVMTKALAAEIDRVGLEGSGTPPEPKGIRNTPGRHTQTDSGALVAYTKFITAFGQLLGANADLAQISKFAVMSPGTWAQLEGIATGISSDKTRLARPNALRNMNFLVTSAVPGNTSSSPQIPTTVYLGDFRDLLLGTRLESSIEILKLTSFATNLLLEFIGYCRADFVVTRPKTFRDRRGHSGVKLCLFVGRESGAGVTRKVARPEK